MQFQVPQFIEVEDKMFGPFTIKQFVYLAGAAGIVFILYSFVPLWLAIVLGAPISALGIALAFYKVNDRPFVNVVEAAVKYIMSSRLYVWHKEQKKPVSKKDVAENANESTDLYVPKLSDSKLKDIAWSLDIQESMYTNEDQRR